MTPTQDDPADVFVECFDALDPKAFLTHAAVPTWYRSDRWVSLQAKQLERSVIATGRADPALWVGAARRGQRGLFAVCMGLERALAVASPQQGAVPPQAMAALACRYAQHGRFNQSTSGGLVLRRALPGRPRTMADSRKESFFQDLIRVPADVWDAADYGRVPVRHDFPLPLPQKVPVACVPMMACDDLTVRASTLSGRPSYRTELSPDVAGRVQAVLDALDHSGALIAILPEYALSGPMLEAWRLALAAPPPRGSKLVWLLPGTGPIGASNPPENRAVLINRRTRAIVLEQDKCCDFPLVRDHQRSWGWEGALGGVERVEHITLGGTVRVRDSNLGRLAILICQDLSETQRSLPAVTAFGVSHVFSPVLAPPLSRNGWVVSSGSQYVLNVGTCLVVSTSRAVGVHPTNADVTTSLAIRPGKKGSWTFSVEMGNSGRVDQVGILKVDRGI